MQRERRLACDRLVALAPVRGVVVWERALDELQLFYERMLVRARGRETPETPDASDEAVMADAVGAYWTAVDVLGRRTAALHRALAAADGDAFRPVPFDEAAVASMTDGMRVRGDRVLERLSYEIGPLVGSLEARAVHLLGHRAAILERLGASADPGAMGLRIRAHGDLHLGQVLDVAGDYYFIDFEGEPARPLAERRERQSPLRDVGGMLRSFSYAAHAGLRQFLRTHPDTRAVLAPWARAWDRWVGQVYLRAYLEAMEGSGLVPGDQAVSRRLVETFVLDKALYELVYELDHRPDWVEIPIDTLLWIVDPAWTPPVTPDENGPHE
ncbi:MAG: hypothetical protein ACLGHP_07500 [Vicinamibacteria bacterium]